MHYRIGSLEGVSYRLGESVEDQANNGDTDSKGKEQRKIRGQVAPDS